MRYRLSETAIAILNLNASTFERYQQTGEHAKRYLPDLILNEIVDIKAYGLGRYNKLLGVLFLEGKNINVEMVCAGLAEGCRRKPASDLNLGPYQKVAAEARKGHRGIWFMAES